MSDLTGGQGLGGARLGGAVALHAVPSDPAPPDRAAAERPPAAWALAGPAQVRAAARRRHRRLLWARCRRPLTAVALIATLALAVRAWPSGDTAGATVDVWVAARDLPAGATLNAADQRHTRWPADLAPAGALPEPATGVLGAPMSAGEPFTRARLLGDGLLAGQPADVVALAFPVPAALAALARPGDRLRIVAAGRASSPDTAGDDGGPEALGLGVGSRPVTGVEEAVVLRGAAAIIGEDSGLLGGPAGASADQSVTVVLGVTSAAARRLAGWDPQRVVVTLVSPASGAP